MPCIYYGTEQGFDGGGDNDSYVRECMFGGEWGAFDSRQRHFFKPGNPIYKNISQIAAGAPKRPSATLRSPIFAGGFQQWRAAFRFPAGSSMYTMASSRILDPMPKCSSRFGISKRCLERLRDGGRQSP